MVLFSRVPRQFTLSEVFPPPFSVFSPHENSRSYAPLREGRAPCLTKLAALLLGFFFLPCKRFILPLSFPISVSHQEWPLFLGHKLGSICFDPAVVFCHACFNYFVLDFPLPSPRFSSVYRSVECPPLGVYVVRCCSPILERFFSVSHFCISPYSNTEDMALLAPL